MQLSGGLTPQTKLRAELSGEFLRQIGHRTNQDSKSFISPSNYLTVIGKDMMLRRQFDFIAGETLCISNSESLFP